MFLDLLSTIHTQSLVGVPLQQARHDAACLGWHVRWEVERICQDTLVHGVDILVVKRRKASLSINDVNMTEANYKMRSLTIIS